MRFRKRAALIIANDVGNIHRRVPETGHRRVKAVAGCQCAARCRSDEAVVRTTPDNAIGSRAPCSIPIAVTDERNAVVRVLHTAIDDRAIWLADLNAHARACDQADDANVGKRGPPPLLPFVGDVARVIHRADANALRLEARRADILDGDVRHLAEAVKVDASLSGDTQTNALNQTIFHVQPIMASGNAALLGVEPVCATIMNVEIPQARIVLVAVLKTDAAAFPVADLDILNPEVLKRLSWSASSNCVIEISSISKMSPIVSPSAAELSM